MPHIALLVLMIVLVVGTGVYIWKVSHESKTDKSSSAKQADATPQKSINNTTAQPADEQWKTYSNGTYGVSFRYPQAWVVGHEGNVSSSSPTFPISFTANINFDVPEKYAESAVFEVVDESIADVISYYMNAYNNSSQSITSKDLTVGSHNAVQLSHKSNKISADRGEILLVSVEDKTYSFRSINEELNLTRSSSYQEDIANLLSSVTVN